VEAWLATSGRWLLTTLRPATAAIGRPSPGQLLVSRSCPVVRGSVVVIRATVAHSGQQPAVAFQPQATACISKCGIFYFFLIVI
jgi:hypothetical protein